MPTPITSPAAQAASAVMDAIAAEHCAPPRYSPRWRELERRIEDIIAWQMANAEMLTAAA